MMHTKKMILAAVVLLLALAACQSAPADPGPAEVEQPAAPTQAEQMPEEPAAAPTETSDEPTVEELPEPPAGTLALAELEGLGMVLVDGEGYTLYLFTRDEQGGLSTCYDDCAASWPPLLVEGDVVVGEGLDQSLVGTVVRNDDTVQVTYNGWPLYYYSDDFAPGEANGQGRGDVWFAVLPSGDKATAEENIEY